MPNKWPDGRALQAYPQVYVSPYQDATHPQALFVGSCEKYVIPDATGPKGLIKSTDGGATWTIVPSLEGVPVQDIAFDPNDHSHLVLVTSDRQVYTSSDWGDSWTQVTTTGLTPSSLGLGRIDHLQSRRLRSVDRRHGAAGRRRSLQERRHRPDELAGRVAVTRLRILVPHVHQCQLGLHLPVSQQHRRRELGSVRPIALVWLRRRSSSTRRIPRRPTSPTTRSGCRRPPIGGSDPGSRRSRD